MDALPFVVDVYKRDLDIEHYFIGYLQHPYVSLYTGRGCQARCTFCLWPQTVGGHRYRTRSAEHVVDEIAKRQGLFPQVKEFFFDDDTFTDDRAARRGDRQGARQARRHLVLQRQGQRADYETLKMLKDNGLRLLLVGYESGNQQILNNIKKGMRIDGRGRFSEHCHKLGITIHGTFILGLPGETRETIEETIHFAKEINPHTLQVSLAAAYPGTYLYDQAKQRGWLVDDNTGGKLVDDSGIQIASLNYPDLSQQEIFAAVADFYKQFYFRPGKIYDMVSEMVSDFDMMKRRLREGVGVLPLPVDPQQSRLRRSLQTRPLGPGRPVA